MTLLKIRLLKPDDEHTLTSFLKHYDDYTLFLQFNLLRGGLNYSGKPGQGMFWGAFHKQELVSVLSLTWNGHLQLYAPDHIEELCQSLLSFLAASGRTIKGANGHPLHIRETIKHLGVAQLPRQWDADETLYSLQLSELVVPSLLASGACRVRTVRPEDYETLVQWQIGYACDALGEQHTPALEQATRKRISYLIDQPTKDTCILERNDHPVSRTNFTARTDHSVMIGGVWTPPEERGNGYARSAVAGSLLEARDSGVKKAMLYTHSEAAAKAYTSIGFKKIGTYTLFLLAEPWTPPRSITE